QTCAREPLFAVLCGNLEDRAVHPAIAHGDLAPWNIKVLSDGAWMVLDWERGEREGLPGWDWFHYEVQPALLVQHESTAALIGRLERLLATPAFRAYTQLSAIAGVERQMALAYLLYQNEIIRPSEGLAESRQLLRALAARWQLP